MELSSSRDLKTKQNTQKTWNVALLPKGIYIEKWQKSNNIFEFSENWFPAEKPGYRQENGC